jgi:hypothetical protein
MRGSEPGVFGPIVVEVCGKKDPLALFFQSQRPHRGRDLWEYYLGKLVSRQRICARAAIVLVWEMNKLKGRRTIDVEEGGSGIVGGTYIPS